ncbi:MAG: YraN family protein [Chloroflexi bacterium]|nr:YraN family protein [Chloroflexota bacterium]
MTTRRQSLGKFGETYAVAMLTRAGLDVVERNVRLKSGELDIVARDGTMLVFVEVRAKRGGAFGTPEESITAAKAARLARLGHEYIEARKMANAEWRIDVVALEIDKQGKVTRAEHLKNAVGESPA